MHDTNAASSSVQHASVKRENRPALSHAAKQKSLHASATSGEHASHGLLNRMLQFVARLFKRAPVKDPVVKQATIAVPDLSDVQRVAASRAAHMAPPVAFIGNTASTVATPIGAYAGKPVEYAIRKRAEQQFKNMDLSQTTMN